MSRGDPISPTQIIGSYYHIWSVYVLLLYLCHLEKPLQFGNIWEAWGKCRQCCQVDLRIAGRATRTPQHGILHYVFLFGPPFKSEWQMTGCATRHIHFTEVVPALPWSSTYSLPEPSMNGSCGWGFNPLFAWGVKREALYTKHSWWKAFSARCLWRLNDLLHAPTHTYIYNIYIICK